MLGIIYMQSLFWSSRRNFRALILRLQSSHKFTPGCTRELGTRHLLVSGNIFCSSPKYFEIPFTFVETTTSKINLRCCQLTLFGRHDNIYVDCLRKVKNVSKPNSTSRISGIFGRLRLQFQKAPQLQNS